MNIINANSKTAIFTTTKAGKKLSKRASTARNLPEGTRVGCDTVRVTLTHVSDYNALIASDVSKLISTPLSDLKAQILEIADFSFTDQDLEDALRGNARGRKGLITSLTQTATNSNPDNEHLEAYEPHPSGWGKIHIASGEYHISGMLTKYEVLERDPERPDPVNSGVVVKLKNLISKILDLDTAKWRQFKIDQESVTLLP